MSILIAEDNVAQRAYLREILERDFPAHRPVIEAVDGEETVAMALKNKPEVCILDIQMPKLSGVKAALSGASILRRGLFSGPSFRTRFTSMRYAKSLSPSIRRRLMVLFIRTIRNRAFCVLSPRCWKMART